MFRARIVEVLGNSSRNTSTSISQRSWNTPPTSNQWKEADKNKLLHLLQALKQRQTEEEAERQIDQSSHRVAQNNQQPSSDHPLTHFQRANNQGGSFSFSFSSDQLNNAVENLQAHLERFNIGREPPPVEHILAQQVELRELIERQMAGINKVQSQIKALTSDESDTSDHVENWSLDVIFASTSPDLLSNNLHERVAMMDTINKRLEKKLTKQAEKL